MPGTGPAATSHHQHEDNPWTIAIGDHPDRTDSAGYVRSRKLMISLVQVCQPFVFGERPYHDHHGGGLWVKDSQGWLMVLSPFGIEWSAQFCADPKKVDGARVYCQRVLSAFPDTVAGYESLGYHDAAALLSQPITTAAQVARWTDSIFNASVPLPDAVHIGSLPKAAGYHHYPKPIVDILLFKYDDFNLFVPDGAGNTIAVTPVGRRGSGDGRVAVAWTPNDVVRRDTNITEEPALADVPIGTVAHDHPARRGSAAAIVEHRVILPADSVAAKAAFRLQTSAPD